ncbi:transcriptional regulator [Methanocella sp. CWC-04]|uniref:Transcriptional regulator n=1 Tax=Methanooceanicella nereidis TaxID=2052831 RepID=A0AAP2W5S7_9EURY|nr:CBS domain-containing protein [Methanocella sp. CWC-04]MCD1293426.1 transcriptional regulator [Methanocella sp. CWC-04]
MNVSEITTNKFECIDIKATLQEVLPLFTNTNHPSVLVFDGKEYAGMLTEKSIVRSIKNLKTGIHGLVKKTPKITPETTIYEAARLMVENQLKQLPVFDKKIVGVVTNESLLSLATEGDFGKKPVSSIMSGDVITLDVEDNVGKLINVFREEGISRVPVISNGKLAGIVTMHDMLHLIKPNKTDFSEGCIGVETLPTRKILIKDMMTESVITVKPDATIKEAVDVMLKKDIQGLVIYDGKIKGIVTRTDVLLALATLAKTEIPNFTVQMTSSNIVDYDQQYMATSLGSFVKKFEKFLGHGNINVYFKQYKETFRGTPLVICKLRLKTDKHFYSARGESWGADGAFHIAMTTLERQVVDDKEIYEDKRYTTASLAEKLDIL